MATRISPDPAQDTFIYRRREDQGEGQDLCIGFVGQDGTIYRLRWDEGLAIGRVDAEGRLFRHTQHDEREIGSFSATGHVHSHGLFEGGTLGWVDPDGVVVQGGLIFGEEEVGRVQGNQLFAAGAALLLIFLPDEQEENRTQARL